jgi:hypothetical protein
MVKTTQDRQTKTTVKYDPYINMLRAKFRQNVMKDKFQVPAYQDFLVDVNVKQWVIEMGLVYGQVGTLFDLTKKYVWRITTLTSAELTLMHAVFISKGFTEAQYATWLLKLYAKFSEMTNQYSFCHRETSKIWIDVTWKEPENAIPRLNSAVSWEV